MEMNIKEYLSEDEMRDMARQAFYDTCVEKFRGDHERIFTNTAYKVVWAEVDKIMGNKAAEMIAERVPKVIEGLSEYSVFRAKGIYDKEDSPGQKMLQEAVLSNKEEVKNKVCSLIDGISKEDIMNVISFGDFTIRVSNK